MNFTKSIVGTLLVLFALASKAQVFEFKEGKKTHRIIKTENYLVETIFEQEPPVFGLTRGGFYKQNGEDIKVDFEFNSNFEADGLNQMNYSMDNNWKEISKDAEELQNNWLFTSRIKDGIESTRRGEESSRKTLKILFDGYFQWIAYDVDGMKFYGSGGGLYLAKENKYTEVIQYFSKDNSRVGAILDFNFELKNGEWNHKGKSSKGDPIHEIWVKR